MGLCRIFVWAARVGGLFFGWGFFVVGLCRIFGWALIVVFSNIKI